jgi:LmbE family N-acetylglucosaminyl deacetylase
VTLSRPAAFDGRLLVIAPHMDDESLGCGVLLATHPRKDQAHVLIVTDGSLSPVAPRPDAGAARRLVAQREQEARDALAVLGVPGANIMLIGLPDGSLPAMGARLRAALTGHIQRIAPHSVFVPFRYDRHPDHLAVNRAVCDARRAGDIEANVFEYFVYSQWRLLRTGDVRDYLPSESLHRLQPGTANDTKRRALECHRSQTTCFYPGQLRPVLSPELLDRVCAEPEAFLVYDAALEGRRGLARGRAWVPVAHVIEPVLKRWKDRLRSGVGA